MTAQQERARILVNEREVADNLHVSVEDIIRVTRPRRYAVPLEVSGDALARARRGLALELAPSPSSQWRR